MIQFILKDKISDFTKEISLDKTEFFENSDQFSGLDITEACDHFSYSLTDSEALILMLNPSDLTITYANLPFRNVFNLNYEISEGKSLFDVYTSLEYIGLKEIFDNMEVGESRKFDYTVFIDGDLIHYYIINIFKSKDSILFSSSQNINYEGVDNAPYALDKSIGATIIVCDDSIVYVDDNFLNLSERSKEELLSLNLDDVYDDIKNTKFFESYNDIKKGYSLSKESNLIQMVGGVETDFRVVCSSIIFKNKPSIRISLLDLNNSNLIDELSFKNQNDLQMLCSFAKIANFNQNPKLNGLEWSSDASSVLGMVPSSKSLNEDLFAFIISEEKAIFEKTWIDAIINKQDIITEFTIKTPNDEFKHLYLFAKINYSGKGEILSISGFIQDVSQVVSYKNKLESSFIDINNYLKEERRKLYDFLNFIYNISTEELIKFNNPGESLEKTQDRVYFILLAFKTSFDFGDLKYFNLNDYFNKFIKELLDYFDVLNLELNLDISNDGSKFYQVFILAISISEIFYELFGVNSPQLTTCIDIEITKKEKEVKLNLVTDLILYDENEIKSEFKVLRTIVDFYEDSKLAIDLTDLGTEFSLVLKN